MIYKAVQSTFGLLRALIGEVNKSCPIINVPETTSFNKPYYLSKAALSVETLLTEAGELIYS